jgi:hypothetical protein
MPSGEASNQCHEAITAAHAATAAGTWVYTIAYGASTSSAGSCSTDSPSISACTTLSNMASSAAYFYSDGQGVSGACQSPSNASLSELVGIFGSLGSSFGTSRLLPDNTT